MLLVVMLDAEPGCVDMFESVGDVGEGERKREGEYGEGDGWLIEIIRDVLRSDSCQHCGRSDFVF